MKTNKSYTKRIRVTKKGKVLAMTPGRGHFNAKTRRSKQLGRRKPLSLSLSQQTKRRFLPKTK